MILILSQSFPPQVGGVQNLVGGLAEALDRAGHRVEVMVDSSIFRHGVEIGMGDVVVRHFGGLKLLRRRTKAWAAGRLLAREAVRAIFCDSWKSVELLAPTEVSIGVLAHGAEFPSRASLRKKRRIRKALAKARVVIANSRYTAELARPYLSTHSRLVVIHPPIWPQPDPTPAARELLAGRFPSARPLLVGLGRLEPRKGFDRVIEALPGLGRQFPGVALAIGGEGEDAGRLKRLAKRAGVANRVHLLGRLGADEKAALLSLADLFVMPTRREGSSVEGFGIVYAEAAWYGVPAVAGRVGGGGDAVIDGETGLVVPGNDPVAVQEAIAALLADGTRRKAMGAAARGKVQTTGVWHSALPRYLESVTTV